MCGIVGAIGQRQISGILMEGLKRLEYRGYDSAGLALIDGAEIGIQCIKTVGKVEKLEERLRSTPALGNIGIAHTRWATHGKPTENNAHPHLSGGVIALVHNGIIENYATLKSELMAQGYDFITETDTEVVAHLLDQEYRKLAPDFVQTVKNVVGRLEGAYALAVLNKEHPDRIMVARSGSPLVIGVGIGENFIASDPSALGQVTDRFIYLDEGDIALVQSERITIWNEGREVQRDISQVSQDKDEVVKGKYRHYMLKEIFEQMEAIEKTLSGRISKDHIMEEAFGVNAKEILDRTKSVQIVACGTSFHAGLIAKHWLEQIAGIPCQVDIASEYRYRKVLVPPDCLFITISQSGETADTLAAHRHAKKAGYVGCVTICNVPNSSLCREADISLMTVAGREIGVASTKAFTTQLAVLALLSIVLGRRNGLSREQESKLVAELEGLPAILAKTLELDEVIKEISYDFVEKQHSLFLGRGVQYPVAMEGALKLKEISYIHAEAYPAGELKHGPLALVDNDMPVIAVAPNNELLEKLKSNLQEVSARGGCLYVFSDVRAGFSAENNSRVINVPHCGEFIAPIVYTIPLQLLAYHVAVIKGTDVDKPRNLAKSVTVE